MEDNQPLMMYLNTGDKKLEVYQSTDTISGCYKYLIDKVLVSAKDMDRLTEVVKETYFDILNGKIDKELLSISEKSSAISPAVLLSNDFNPPNVRDISEEIDERNIETIGAFFSKYEIKENEIDSIIARYEHDLGCNLIVDVEYVLMGLGFPYSGSSHSYTENSYYRTPFQMGQLFLFEKMLSKRNNYQAIGMR